MTKLRGPVTRGRLAFTGALLAGLLVGPAQISVAQDSLQHEAAARCSALVQKARPDLNVTEAELVRAGPFSPPAPGPGSASAPVLPEHCRVRATINPRVGQGGRDFGIGFELRLPVDWNGRFLFQGGGGMDGVVQPAIGSIANSTKGPALQHGFAVVSTDAGHSGSPIDASFGLDQQARIDYAYNALDKVTIEAKRLVAAFYNEAPRFSYMLGCSNGGRQALTFAQRMPLHYDGIVAGAPAMRFSGLAIGQVWNQQVMSRIAPKDDQGRPIVSRAFSDTDLRLVRDAVLKRCDAKDGLADGLINDWRRCEFDPAELTCRAGKTDGCLAADQVEALRELYRGPLAPDGRSVYGPFTFDTGIASAAWRGIRLGTSETGISNAGDATLGAGQLRLYQLTPPAADYDPFERYDLAEILRRVRYTAAMGDADSPYLSTFASHGKMIVYNGLSDQGMATPVIADWYEKMIEATGVAGREAVRLFAVPGMLHCGGGEATDEFEMLDAIVDWVERGKAPDRIIATSKAMPGISRPLCPYPQFATYRGGETSSAESFVCG
ncbi:MAG: tannase/feruloyl esterase family alpha/beta hydrolase [Porphyrobacter sp.]|nr:tannase/feruloyl esterase family alpha/beta hydrolase [Porphyrobacter sp.]